MLSLSTEELGALIEVVGAAAFRATERAQTERMRDQHAEAAVSRKVAVRLRTIEQKLRVAVSA